MSRTAKAAAFELSLQVSRLLQSLFGVAGNAPREAEWVWKIGTPGGPVSICVSDFCNAPELVTIFMRCEDMELALARIPEGEPHFNRYSGKWNIHVSGKVPREQLCQDALVMLRKRLSLLGCDVYKETPGCV